MRGDEGIADKRISTRHHDDGVFTLLVHGDDRQARHLFAGLDVREVHAAGLQVVHRGRGISIAAHRADEADLRAKAGGSDRLVCSFAARSNGAAVPQEGFARLGMPRGVDHEVSVDGTDYAHAHADQYAR